MAANKRSEIAQVDELIAAAKVTVFFIDNQQVVRPGEVGSTDLIEDAATTLGAQVVKEQLQAQFRCAGSDDYIDWIDAMLGLRATDASIYDTD